MVKLFKILIFILLCFLIGVIIGMIRDFEGCKLFYLSNEGTINFVIDMFILFATLCAALANLGMLQSNKSMVTAANNEIELLKVQHRYLISPIIKLYGYSFGVNSIKLLNCTNNPAIDLLIFAKLFGDEYISKSYFVGKEEKVHASFKRTYNLHSIFKNKYHTYLNSFDGFEKIFRDYLKNTDMFFIVYIDVEGNIHGTASVCQQEEWDIPNNDTYISFLRKTLTEEEIKIRYAKFLPQDEHFYILSEKK